MLNALDNAVDATLPIWEKWFTAITGEGVAAELPDDLPWWNVLRLHRRDISIENPGFIGAKVVRTLGEGAGRELLDVLKRSPEDRASLIGQLYERPESRWLAEALMDIEEDPDDLVRLRISACNAASSSSSSCRGRFQAPNSSRVSMLSSSV